MGLSRMRDGDEGGFPRSLKHISGSPGAPHPPRQSEVVHVETLPHPALEAIDRGRCSRTFTKAHFRVPGVLRTRPGNLKSFTWKPSLIRFLEAIDRGGVRAHSLKHISGSPGAPHPPQTAFVDQVESDQE